jgi:hypothetical protein
MLNKKKARPLCRRLDGVRGVCLFVGGFTEQKDIVPPGQQAG